MNKFELFIYISMENIENHFALGTNPLYKFPCMERPITQETYYIGLWEDTHPILLVSFHMLMADKLISLVYFIFCQ